MKKALFASLIFLAAGISFAGDAAAFNDIGFSADGKIYIFSQYGKTDKKFQPYAEIYTIDVEKNEYVPGGVYKNLEAKSDRNGKTVYEELCASHYYDIKKYDCRQAQADDVLYVLEDAKKSGTEEIVFKNLGEENLFQYNIRLMPTFDGRGKECRSSFYIDLVVSSEGGPDSVKKYVVGSPDIRRKGVTGYKIIRIFRDAKKTSLIFVVEKTVEDSSGTSIRYMVETVKL